MKHKNNFFTQNTSHIWDVVKMYGWKSVFFSYFRYLTILILLTTFPLYCFIYYFYSYAAKQNLQTYVKQISMSTKDVFEAFMTEFDKNFYMMASNPHTKKFLRMSSSELLEDSKELEELNSYLNTITEGNNYIRQASIFSFSNEYIISNDSWLPASESVADKNSWFCVYASAHSDFLFFPRKKYSEEFDTLYIAKELVSDFNAGVFCIEIDYNYFSNIVEKTFSVEPQEIYILSDIGLILYSRDPQYINSPIFRCKELYSKYREMTEYPNGIQLQPDKVSFLTTSKNSKLELYFTLNYEQLHLENISGIKVILFGSILLFIAALIISLIMAIKMYRSVYELISVIQFPDRNNSPSSELGEFLYISANITSAYLDNININAELSEKLEQLKSSQSMALQAQINPHFLFNTLQMINMSILKEVKQDNDSTRLVTLLSELLRRALDTDQYYVTVEDELEYTKKYLEIQKIRYKERLSVHIEIDEDVYNYKTIKLLCQPIIENCFVHGLIDKKNNWQVSLHCYYDSDRIYFEIWDNGMGMDSDKLEQLQNILNQKTIKESRNIGLANVNARLRLLFNDNYNISIQSKPSLGTKIVIWHSVI